MAEDSSGNWIDPDSVPGNGPAVMGGFAAVGLGLQAYGAYEGYQAAKDTNAASISKIGHEQQLEGMKYQAMQIMNERKNRENLRNVQRARALSISSAVGSGQGVGSFAGSGVSGSIGAEGTQGAVNALGLSQNLQFGQQAFGIQSSISSDKIAMAQANMKSQEGNAWGSIGKSLMQAAPYAAMLLV